MAKFITLYSGSSGNSTLVLDGGSAFLIDMGRSCKQTLGALYAAGVGAGDLRAIFITHEHSDHVSGLTTYLKHYNTPVYGSYKTLLWLRSGGVLPETATLCPLAHGETAAFGRTSVRCFGTSHDATDCVGYRFALSNGRALAVATDLGCVTDEVRAGMDGCALVGLESNYDEQMLLAGRYPPYLKSRIRSRLGHLSNEDCARYVAELARGGAQSFVLMHLSAENNAPEIALTCTLAALEDSGLAPQMPAVRVAPRFEAGEPLEV